MPRRPEPLQTTRMLSTGVGLWVLWAAIYVIQPDLGNSHANGLVTALTQIAFNGGLIFLLIGMFLRATAWAQAWRDGTDAQYEVPGDARVSERLDYPADDDPDF